MASTLGWIATVLFTVCYIPQIVKTLKTKTTDGLSVWLLIIAFIANVDALCYATLIHQKPLQVKYSLALVFLFLCLYAYWSVRNKRP